MRPSTVFLYAVAFWMLFCLAGLWLPGVISIGQIVGAVIFLAACFDGILVLTKRNPEIRREAPGMVNRDSSVLVRLNLENIPSSRKLRLFDGLPEFFDPPATALEFDKTVLRAREAGLVIEYRTVPRKRGLFWFSPAWCEYQSMLGLWWRRCRSGAVQEIRVFPPFWKDQHSRLALMAGISQAGAFHTYRRRGLGTEFHQLREYREGDQPRQLDWKASSRYYRPIVREYQEEQNQEIVFVLDTGYRLHASEGGVSHFDRALEGLLLLASIALKQGDSVGVMTFGPAERWISPVKGNSGLNILLSRLFDLESQAYASSPGAALEKVQTLLKRRSLVVLLSNVREEDAQGIDLNLTRLLSRHMLLALWLQEEVVQTLLAAPSRNFEESLPAAAARLYLDDRSSILETWSKKGVLVMDTVPEKLSAQLVNSYWEIKKSGRL